MGRGARPRQRRWRRRQKGAASEKPAHLLCEHEEDRNRRRPHPRGPNAKKPRTGVYFAQQCFQNPRQFSHQEVKEFLQSVNTKSCFCSTKLRYHPTLKIPQNIKLRIWVGSVPRISFVCSQPIWFGSDLVPPVKLSEPERLRPIKGRTRRPDGLKFGQNVSLNC